MNKIEQAMIHAIYEGKNWRSGNTRVEHEVIQHGHDHPDSVCKVYLRAYEIAQITYRPLNTEQVILTTMFHHRGWIDDTMKSRMNAIADYLELPLVVRKEDYSKWCYWGDKLMDGKSTYYQTMRYIIKMEQ